MAQTKMAVSRSKARSDVWKGKGVGSLFGFWAQRTASPRHAHGLFGGARDRLTKPARHLRFGVTAGRMADRSTRSKEEPRRGGAARER